MRLVDSSYGSTGACMEWERERWSIKWECFWKITTIVEYSRAVLKLSSVDRSAVTKRLGTTDVTHYAACWKVVKSDQKLDESNILLCENLENFCKTSEFLSSTLGNFLSTFVGTLLWALFEKSGLVRWVATDNTSSSCLLTV